MHPRFDTYEWKWNMYDTIVKSINANLNAFAQQHWNKQMTREKAIEIAKKLGHEKPYYESDIALLEALGLLKFDEVKQADENAKSGTAYWRMMLDSGKPIDWIDRANFYLENGGSTVKEIVSGLLKELEKRPKVGDVVTIVNPHFNSDEYTVRGKLVSIG